MTEDFKTLFIRYVSFFTLCALSFSLWLDYKEINNLFKSEVKTVNQIFTQRIASIETIGVSLASLLEAADNFNETELSNYSEQILKAYPFIDAIIGMSKVYKEEIKSFEMQMEKRGFIQFEVKFLNQNSKKSPTRNIQYFPINFIEPMTPSNVKVLGLELYSSKIYFDDIRRAIQTGKIIASDINQVTSKNKSEILLFKALYAGRYDPNNDAERMATVSSLVALKVNIEEFMNFISLNNPQMKSTFENAPINFSNKIQIAREQFITSSSSLKYIEQINIFGQAYQLQLMKGFDFMSINAPRVFLIWLLNVVLAYFIALVLNKRKEAENALKDSEKRFVRIAQATPIGIFQKDINGHCIFINDGYKKIAKIDEPDALGDGWSDYIYPNDKKKVFEELALSVKEKKPFVMNYRQLIPDNGFIWVHCRSDAEYDSNGEILSYMGTIQDITEQKKAEEKILYQAHFDELTGMANRFLILDRLTRLLSEAQRDGHQVALLFIDLDDFKKVNDSLGHEAGDEILIEAAARLKSIVRSGDSIGRLGGDEFLMLVGSLREVPEVISVVESVIEKFRQPFTINEHELIITTSIGIALYPDDGVEASEMLANADLAMYHAKELGRNAYSFFTEKLNEDNSRRIEIDEQLRGALGREELSVLFQPKVNTADASIMGVEALLRWHNKVLGDVSPAEFIPIAEQSDVIFQIGEYVFNVALGALARWQTEFNRDFQIAVNVSPNQFRDPRLLKMINDGLDEHLVLAQTLELEMTEGVLLNKHVNVGEILSSLSERGINISMDDFGTGYSSLSYLQSYPFDVLKIDQSFIQAIGNRSSDNELVSATVAMAHGLNLKVVAEGVETKEQYDFLKKLQCDFIQGFYFSKAVTASEIDNMLSSNAGSLYPV